jgi:hypothetical protein
MLGDIWLRQHFTYVSHKIENSRVMIQIVASLTDNSGNVIYDHNMFIVQATGWK